MMAELLVGLSLLIGIILSSFTIWSRKNTLIRGATVLLWVFSVPTIAGIYFTALSFSGPYYLAEGGKYTLLGYKLVQDEAIYVYLDFGQNEPRSFNMPWDNETANKIQELSEKAKAGRIEGITTELPKFEYSWERRKPLTFHAMPHPIAPIPKGDPDQAPHFE